MRRMTVDEIRVASRYLARKRADREVAHYDRVTFYLFAGVILTIVGFLAYIYPA